MRTTKPLTRNVRAVSVLALIILSGAAGHSAAQQVHVFAEGQPQDGSTIIKSTTPDDTARLLVIPVVTADSPFDPNNNQLDGYNPLNPNLRQDILDRFDETNDFWLDASYDHVGAQVTVLERYYQMPREEEFYVNPAYQSVRSTGSMLTYPANVSEGQFKLEVHVSDSDSTTYTIEFEAADSPFATAAALVTHINEEISVNPSFDKVDTSSVGGALRFQMGQRHVRAGSYARIDQSASDNDVLEALNLDTPAIDFATAEITSKGAEFPVAVAGASTVTLRIQYEDGTFDDFLWNIPAGSNFANPAAFVAAHGGDVAGAAVAAAGGELTFDLTPTKADPIENVVALETGPWTLDQLGLDRVAEQVGLVSFAKTNTVKGDRRLIAGQAIAAFMMNELTRVEGGADPIPNINFTAANEAALTLAFQENIDYDGAPAQPYNSYVVMFLDVTGKREGASGGFIDAGVENGGYLFTHQVHGKLQIIYQNTPSGTIAHETGHNYGFPDIYDNGGGNYDPNLLYANRFDIMDSSTLNHPGAWMKSVDSNWVTNDGGAIEVFPMPATPGVETRKIAITPLEYSTGDYDSSLAGLPGDLDATAKVVRLPIGFDAAATHHFLLLQNRQRSQNFSQTIPMAPGAPNRGGLYLTDTITHKVFDYFTITSRNYVHPLTDRALLPGPNVVPILDADPATDIAVNMTYPAYAGLTIDIVDTIPGPAGAVDRSTYIVEISREQSDFLDLALTPWGAPPWESPDIWIEHGNKAEADLSTVPLEGNGEPARWSSTYDPNAPGNDGKPLNWIRVNITNNGTVDATGVQLKVKVNSPGAMGDKGTWVELDLSEPLDVPASGSTIFSVPWNPTVRGHTCIQVEIFRWTSALGDVDLTNNGTQENVNSFRPTAGSPWNPAPFSVDVSNPFDRELEISLDTEGLRPGFSVAWDKTFFVMPPRSKTTRTGVLHIDEDIVPTPEPDGTGGIIFHEYQCAPDIEITAAVLDDVGVRCDKVRTKPIRMFMHVVGYANAGDFRVPIGGVTYNVQPTLRTDIDVRVIGRGGDVRVEGETHPKAAGQDMEIEVQYPSGRFDWIPVRTDSNGRFVVTFSPIEDGTVGVAVNYPDGGDFAPVKVEGQLYDPNAPSAGGGVGFLPCASCEVQSLFWLLNFVLLILVLILLVWIWRAMRRATP